MCYSVIIRYERFIKDIQDDDRLTAFIYLIIDNGAMPAMLQK